MLSCKEISKLVSQSIDQKLTWRERMNIWMHLKMCRLCSAFRRDVLRLRRGSREQAILIEDDASMPEVKLSAGATKRIKQAIQSHSS